jgi:MFS family permease
MFKSINRVIRTLIFGDILFNMGWGLIAPVFAIFIIQNIQGGDIKTVGFAAAIYWIVKSSLQIPIARSLDKNHGETDDFHSIFFGFLLAGTVPFGYLISYLPWHIYALQFLNAIAMAMVVPAWYAVYSRHVDKDREAFEWGMDSTSLGFVLGVSGAIGGIVADIIGFKFIFIIVGVLTIASAFSLLLVKNDIIKR